MIPSVRLLIMCSFFLQSTVHAFPPSASSPRPTASPQREIIETSDSPIDFADAQLKAAGLPPDFIHQIHTSFLTKKNKNWTEQVTKITELNVFGFLAQSDYFAQDSPLAQKKIKQYLKGHRKTFLTCKKKYSVSPSAIASLLWVETKHGKTIGPYPMPFVFYALVMGSHPSFVHSMLSELPDRIAKSNPKGLALAAAQEKVIERCNSKAEWAIEELKAIQYIQAEHDFNPFRKKASFAGAFGIAQFIPSSYLKFAISGFRKKPDLFKHSDAILSVAHFLKVNGWRDEDAELQAQALYSYNRSKDYGAVILKLAREVEAN